MGRLLGFAGVPLLAAVSRSVFGLLKIFNDRVEFGRMLWLMREEEVKSGAELHVHGRQMTSTWRWEYLWHGLLAVSGGSFVPVYRKDPMLNVFALFEPRDPEGVFCRKVLDYCWLHPFQGGDGFPQVRSTHSDIMEFVERCRKEFQNLSQEEKDILDPYRQSGEIPMPVLIRLPYDQNGIGALARREPLPTYDAERLRQEDLLRLINRSLAASTWADHVKEAPKAMLDYYDQLDLRAVPPVAAEWPAIGRAIREGKIGVFDATKLFPADVFNVTLRDVADREGGAAARIPVLSNGCEPDSLRRFADDNFRRLGDKVAFNLAGSMYTSLEPMPDIEDSAHRWLDSLSGMSKDREQCKVAYLNNRRAPNFYKKMDVQGMIRKMNLEDDVLRDEGYLWMGPVRGGFHYDEEANIYVQLSGESDVFLVPQSHVDIFTFGKRFRDLPTRQQLMEDPILKRVPFHLFRMKPGEGVVFPGRTFHLFMAQTFSRIAVNFFFLPRWRKMEYTEHDWYTQEAKEPWGKERLALRQLWARSFVRLYEDTDKGIVFMGEKNEYI